MIRGDKKKSQAKVMDKFIENPLGFKLHIYMKYIYLLCIIFVLKNYIEEFSINCGGVKESHWKEPHEIERWNKTNTDDRQQHRTHTNYLCIGYIYEWIRNSRNSCKGEQETTYEREWARCFAAGELGSQTTPD